MMASAAAYSQEWSDDSCHSELQRAYTLFVVRPGATTQGDFNSDGSPDIAKLLDHTALPDKAAVGVCLSGVKKPVVVTNPYESTKVFTKPKGTTYLDYESETEGIYERDAISVSDGTWFGASYILRAGVFVQVVDGD